MPPYHYYMGRHQFVLGVLVGGLVCSLVPDIPTTIDNMLNRPDLRRYTAGSWAVVLFVVIAAGLVYWDER